MAVIEGGFLPGLGEIGRILGKTVKNFYSECAEDAEETQKEEGKRRGRKSKESQKRN